MSIAYGGLMDRSKATRVVIAESGSPWFSLVTPSPVETVVIAQTPDERETDFGRRVEDKLAALGSARVRDILVVTRRPQHPGGRRRRAPKWTVMSLPRAGAAH